MRLDRSLSLLAARPWRRLIVGNGGAVMPILMYHSISEGGETDVSPYLKVRTSPQRFRQHLQCLSDSGVRATSLSEALAELRSPNPSLTHRLAAITFDDGFVDNLAVALPLLEEFGFGATVYVATALIGETGRRRSFKSRECLTWDEVRHLSRAGVEIGSHTIDHPMLVECSPSERMRQLQDSKRELETRLGTPVSAFAYPYAYPSGDLAFCATLESQLAAAGYRSNVTTLVGRATANTPSMRIPRLPVNDDDDLALFRAKIEGDYDWIGTLQAWRKRARHHAVVR